MKKENMFWILSVQILFLFSAIKNTVFVSGQCLDDQRSHLWDLKSSIGIDLERSKRLLQWSLKDDCCSWSGVECDAFGRVITLELDNEYIYGADNLTSIFMLQFLEKLDLGNNYFLNSPLPKAIVNLTNLVYLNLSNSGFSEQIPIELSSLRNLVTLDLSSLFPWGMTLENPTPKMLLQNLSNIEEIYLDGVDLSAQGSEWSQVIATSLPNLRVLSLRKCSISGPIGMSLSSIHNLSDIHLDGNYISAEVPEFFANMPNLRTLSLASCNLTGRFPAEIFKVPSLQTLDISDNGLLQGILPPFPKNSSLGTIVLSSTSFSGSLPNSIGNLHMLSRIELRSCNFSGTIPSAFKDLSRLSFMDLSNNNFTGLIPQFQASKNLVYIDLSSNSLTGSLSSAHFKGLQSLETLHLQNNVLSGSLPTSLFKLKALRSVQLANNHFSGQIAEISDRLSISQTRLEFLDLSSNQFNGSFPKFLFELKELNALSLSSNSFTDTIQLEAFKNMSNLTTLQLSYNNLTVEPQSYNSSLPQLSVLKLVSCKMQSFPAMIRQTQLTYLDLSDNKITGEIPNWIWNLEALNHINLSLNFFTGLQKPHQIRSVLMLDLHSNQLQGDVPIPSVYSTYVDNSRNNFSGPIPSMIGLRLNFTGFLSISHNSLTGSIPDSICNAPSLRVLDLSYNALNGTIPSCLVTSTLLGVLNLAGNNLSGTIPDTFLENCNLKTLDLGRNHLQGKLPLALSNCTSLEILNLGYNKIEGLFPCMFQKSFSLRVLILRSNNIQGDLQCFGYNHSWPHLQIFDIASNNFSGVLSSPFFSSFKNMVTLSFPQELNRPDYLSFNLSAWGNVYYQFKVGVTMKGNDIELEKILTIFTVIDFSNNKFSGKIPESIGDLKELYVLDFSHNEFTGGIPSSIGKLSNLGSLDMSRNQLSGEIPSTVTDLTFLAFLNLSFNILTGKIPTGSQFQTFMTDSYVGNVGLCGFPLKVRCDDANDTGSSTMPMLSNKKEINWMYIIASLGYTVGLGIFSMLLLFCERWRNKFFLQIDQLLAKVFGSVWKEPIRRL